VRTRHSDIFRNGPLNAIRFLPWASSYSCAGAAADGTVRLFDIDTVCDGAVAGGWARGGGLSDGCGHPVCRTGGLGCNMRAKLRECALVLAPV
jgi:hypothetical protein